MSLTSLYNQLTGQAAISLNQSGLGDDGQTLFPLLPELSEATITLIVLQRPTWEDAAQSKFTITGTLQQPLLGMAAPSITFEAIADGNDIQFRMQIETLAGWTFGTSFPQLASTELNLFSFDNTRFILTTVDNPGEKLLKGLNFKGDLQLTNTSVLPAIEEFITEASPSLPVAGTVQKYDHYQLITIKAQIISGNASFSVADLLNFQFSAPDLAFYAYIYSGDTPVAFLKRIESNATLSGASGSRMSLPLALQLPTLVTGWLMMLQPDQNIFLADFLEFLTLLGSAGQFDLIDIFTGELTPVKEILKALVLKSFSIEIIGSLNSTPQFRSFSFQIQQQKNAPWNIVQNRLVLANLQVYLRISKEFSSYNTVGFIQGELGITNSIAINAMIPIPIGKGDWQFFSRHQVGFSDIDVFSKFTDDNSITALLPKSLVQAFSSLTLEEFILIYNPSVGIKQLKFAVSMEESWVIIQDCFELASLYLHLKLEKGTTGWGLSGNIQSVLLAGGVNLDSQLDKPIPESDWFFNLHANHIPLPSLADLSRLTGGENALADMLPDSLLTAQLYLNDPRLKFNLNQRKLETFGFSLATDEIDFEEIKIIQAGVDVDIIFLSQPINKNIKIYGWFVIANIDIFVESDYSNTGGWQLQGKTGLDQQIPIGDLATDLANKFSKPLTSDPTKNEPVVLPEPIRTLNLENLATSFNTKSKDFTVACDSKFTIDSEPVVISVEINVIHQQDNSFEKYFGGHITVGGLQFTLIFDTTDKTSQVFLAAYHDTTDNEISVKKLIGSISSTLQKDIPDGLTISLKDALFAYHKNNTQTNFLFGLDIGSGINLSNLPLVGKEFPPDQTIKLAYQVLVTKADFSQTDITHLNTLYTQGGISLPQKDITNRLDISTSMRLGQETRLLSLPLEIQSGQLQKNSQATSNVPSSADVTSPDGTKWYQLQKAFGPVHFERVGVQYKNGTIWFLLDAALSAAGLTLSLDGLSVNSPLTKFEPKFDLKGIGIDYQGGGAIEIGGAFLRKQVTKDGQTYDEYDGAAIIKAKAFTLSAIGSYTSIHDHPSLFIYAILDYPIGGPSFFFVTGLALGFGYNRALQVPTIEQVATFPLVAEAITPNLSTDSNQELENLQKFIPPETGQTFLAVGVRFTSFNIIDSFALLTVAFGNRFEINILGLSTLIAPPQAGKTPIAEIQLALKGSFLPEQGFLGVCAQLTSNSYIFSKACHLTGGFAFYSWFAPNDHEGEFVLTIGGYHPLFNVPEYYPTVPRLALNWQVNNELQIKADGYFALTASVLMAGGHLQATWNSGDLSAWFNAGADFIITWKPYHYDADIYVDMGVSYTFHFFGTHHISVDLGAELHIWGPEFSGTAHIHLWIVSFDVRFGENTSQTPVLIDWKTFKNSFLPAKSEVCPAESDICSITVKDGLVKKVNPDDKTELGVINSKYLCLVINTVIPAKEVFYQQGNISLIETQGVNTTFGIGSMAVTSAQLSSKLFITISKDEKPLTLKEFQEEFTCTPLLKKVPTGLWGESLAPDLNDKFIEETLSGFEIKPKKQPQPGETHAIDRSQLQFTTETIDNAYRWESIQPFIQDSTKDAKQAIKDTIIESSTARNDLLTHLGIDSKEVNLSQSIAEEFLIPPQIEKISV